MGGAESWMTPPAVDGVYEVATEVALLTVEYERADEAAVDAR